jgi:hypothetical protein
LIANYAVQFFANFTYISLSRHNSHKTGEQQMNDQPNSHLGQPLDIDWAGKGTNYIGLGFKVFFSKNHHSIHLSFLGKNRGP